MASFAVRAFLQSSKCRRSAPSPGHIRRLHQPRPLHFEVDAGLGEFLTPEGTKTIAVDFQHGLLDRINELVQGTRFENMSLAQTVINSAADREQALLFNYSSQALNNSFFLDNLSTQPGPTESKGTQQFFLRVTDNFGSHSHMQSTMSAAAMGMSGSGWVWLVSDQTGQLGVIATYGAGTLLARSRYQHAPPMRDEEQSALPIRHSAGPLPSGPFDPAVGSPAMRSPKTTVSWRPPPPAAPRNPPARNMSMSNHVFSPPLERDISRRGEYLNPLLCISVHEHAWMSSGYGVWGKEEYLKKLWTAVDWERVTGHYLYWSRLQNAPAVYPWPA